MERKHLYPLAAVLAIAAAPFCMDRSGSKNPETPKEVSSVSQKIRTSIKRNSDRESEEKKEVSMPEDREEKEKNRALILDTLNVADGYGAPSQCSIQRKEHTFQIGIDPPDCNETECSYAATISVHDTAEVMTYMKTFAENKGRVEKPRELSVFSVTSNTQDGLANQILTAIQKDLTSSPNTAQ